MRTTSRRILVFALLPVLASCAAQAPVPAITEEPGLIELNQGPITDTASGGSGTGTVFFRGTLYQFTIGGLGVQGSAIAVLQTTGRAYRLTNIGDFSGTYFVSIPVSQIGEQANQGLWLRNEHGAIMHLSPPPQGALPAIGDDGVLVVMQ